MCMLLARAVKVQPIAVRQAQALAEVCKARKRLQTGAGIQINFPPQRAPMKRARSM